MITPQRFRLTPTAPPSTNFGIGLTVPAPVPPSAGCTPSGPYLQTCVITIPDADSKLFVFGLYGLSEDDVVAWTTTLSEGDHVIGTLAAHVLMIQDTGGDGGTVTATVNGESMGTAVYGHAVDSDCVSPYVSEG